MYGFFKFVLLIFFHFRCAKLNCKLKHVKNWFSYKRKCCLRNGKPLSKMVVKKESLDATEMEINKVLPTTPEALYNIPKWPNFNGSNYCSNNGFWGQNSNFNPIRQQLNNYNTVNHAPLVLLNLNDYFRMLNLVWALFSNLV